MAKPCARRGATLTTLWAAAILKVHRSNYEIVGFTETADIGALAEIGDEFGLPVLYDLGSGLIHPHPGSLDREPSVTEALDAGADLVLFSGDKLFGGPQAGIVVGRKDLISRVDAHPLARAMRIDKLQRAALEATLESYHHGEHPTDLPGWAMLETEPDTLARRARAIAEQLGDPVTAAPVASAVGGGASPTSELPSWGLRITSGDPEALAGRLRALDPPVITRIEDDDVVADLRTVAPAQDGELEQLLRAALDRH